MVSTAVVHEESEHVIHFVSLTDLVVGAFEIVDSLSAWYE